MQMGIVRGLVLAAGCVVASGCTSTKTTYVYVRVPDSAPTAPSVLAAPVPAPSADGSFTLTPLPDIVLAPAPARPVRRSLVARDVDQAVTSPTGAYTVAGTAMYTFRGSKGGLAALYATPRGGPTGRPKKIPLTNVEYTGTSFSPDGRHLVVTAHGGLLRDEGTTPTVSIFSVPDLRSLGTFGGIDPHWIDASTIVFRNGRTPYRVAVGGTPAAIGPAQTSFGCTHESFGPGSPCRADLYTDIMAITPDGSGWIVNDNSDTKHIDRVRLLQFSGTPITAFEENAEDKTVSVGFVRDPLFDPNARRDRTCAVYASANQTELRCLLLPSLKPERTILGSEKLYASWSSDASLMLVDAQAHLTAVVDLAARTITHVKGVPAAARYPQTLAGGRRIVFIGGDMVDLDAHTISPSLPGSGFVHPVAGDPNRALLQTRDASSTPSWELADL